MTDFSKFTVGFENKVVKILKGIHLRSNGTTNGPDISDPTYVDAEVNCQKVRVLIETGGGSSMMGGAIAAKLGREFGPVPFDAPRIKFRTIAGIFESPEAYYTDIQKKLAGRLFYQKVFVLCGV